MDLQSTLNYSKKYFPNISIKYKDQSIFMKILGTILFFNKSFMDTYTTTIGSTIYFPNEDFVNKSQSAAIIILLHELVHIYDSKRFFNIIYNFLYLFPQILCLLSILAFVNIYFLLFLLFLLPIPSPRAYFEKRAYMAQLYLLNKLSKKFNGNVDLNKAAENMISTFTTSAYYWMQSFFIKSTFQNALIKINNNEKPFEDPIFDILNDIAKNIT